MNIVIGGDVYLGRRIESIAMNSPEKLYSKEIKEVFESSDLNILNLESPLTKSEEKDAIIKTGPNLKCNENTINALKYLDVDLVTLANNHIYDYGDKGLNDTFTICKKNNIDTVGAHHDLERSRKIFYKEHNGLKIAVLNFSENEWCNASNKKGGANPLNLINNTLDLIEAKKKSDFVMLIIHGGHEFYKYPSPQMKKMFRYFAEMGANTIIGHHTHCYSGYEVFKDVPIFYGLGNFLFDNVMDNKDWYEGFILKLKIHKDKSISTKLIPYSQCRDNEIIIKPLEDKEKFEISIKELNKVIENDKLLKEKFCKFVEEKKSHVLSMFSTDFIFDFWKFRAVIRKLNLTSFFLRRKQLKSVLNYVRCESHRDLTLPILENYILKKNENSNT